MSSKNSKIQGVKENRRFLNFEASFHKLGFVALLFMIFMAVFGVFSGGYFSDSMNRNATGNVALNFERFGRLQTEFKLKISSAKHHGGENIYRIGGDFSKFYQMENIWPQPDRMYSKGNELYLVYNTRENQQDTSIWLFITPLKAGIAVSVVQLNAEPEIHFKQFIYP